MRRDQARIAKGSVAAKSDSTGLMLTAIRCPQCNAEIELGAVLKAHLAGALDSQVETRVVAAAADAENRVRNEIQAELQAYSREAAEARSALQTARAHELELIKREQQLSDREQEMAVTTAKTLAEEREKIRSAEEERARIEAEPSTRILEAELAQVKNRLEESQNAELRLRQDRESVDARERMLDLEIRRRVDEMRADIAVQARTDLAAAHQVDVEERDLEIRRLNERIQSLQQTASASQEVRGEAQELVVRDLLAQAFPGDEVVEVPRGRCGGDFVQIVRTAVGYEAGRIIHETKRTRTFSEGWIEKLKADQREAGADVAVLITRSLPRDISHVGFRDGVLVASLAAAPGAAAIARQIVLRVASMRTESQTRDIRLRQLQELITSTQFRLASDAIFHAIRAMVEELESERQSAHRWHVRRAKRIDLLSHAAGELIAGLEVSAGCPPRELALQDDPAANPADALVAYDVPQENRDEEHG